MKLYSKDDTKEDKRDRETKVVAVAGFLIASLIAATSLLSNSEKLPLWWFNFSFYFIILLTFFVPSMIFLKPISSRFEQFKVKRKQNSVSKKYFSEFKNLVDTSEKLSYPMRDLLRVLSSHYKDDIKDSVTRHILESHYSLYDVNSFYYIKKEIGETNKNFNEFCLIIKYFESSILNNYKNDLILIEKFVHEIMFSTNKPIAPGIESDFEIFREKYNAFLRDLEKFYHNFNQEIGVYVFHESEYQPVKKW